MLALDVTSLCPASPRCTWSRPVSRFGAFRVIRQVIGEGPESLTTVLCYICWICIRTSVGFVSVTAVPDS